MNILYLDPNLNSQVYPYYTGLYSSLRENKSIRVKSYTKFNNSIDSIIKETSFNPDVIVLGLGWFGGFKYFSKISNLKNIPIVSFLFKPQNDMEDKINFCKINNVKLILSPAPIFNEIYKRTNIKTKLFEYGCFIENFNCYNNLSKKFDIGFSGAMHNASLYPEGNFKNNNIRQKIQDILTKEENISTFWKGSDNFSKSRIDNYKDYSKTINSCKIWLATLASHGDVTPRYFEVLSSNTLLFCERPDESYNDILKDEINCVFFNSDLSDFEYKLKYYLNNEQKRLKIVKQSKKYHNNISWSSKAEKFINIIKNNL